MSRTVGARVSDRPYAGAAGAVALVPLAAAAALTHSAALVPPPELAGAAKALSDASRTVFRLGNRFAMIPLHRAGLAAWLGSPLTGWQCLLTTTGRRSGLPRQAPLGYRVADGAVWVMAGFGPSTHWYQNLLVEPKVTLLLPGRPPLDALAAESTDPATRARIIPALCRSMGLPGAMIGCFPPTSTDERILACVAWVPLVRIAPAHGAPLVAGPDDPGGLGWTWRLTLVVGAKALALRALWWAMRR
jgi:deazaflavin-dependent oxidoreductase (nitroreductase family)